MMTCAGYDVHTANDADSTQTTTTTYRHGHADTPALFSICYSIKSLAHSTAFSVTHACANASSHRYEKSVPCSQSVSFIHFLTVYFISFSLCFKAD
jgi:hypothetical protein